MRTIIHLYLFLGLSLLVTSWITHASIVLQGTRIVYPNNKKHVLIQAVNHSEQSSLVQSWVDEGDINSTPETTNAPFIVSPPMTKIDANEGTQLKIQFIGNTLPSDRESIFYLNVRDIAPKPQKTSNANFLQLALQTRIKLFYRPQGLSIKREQAPDSVKFTQSGQQLAINNPTPYFLTLSGLYMTHETEKPLIENILVAPFSHQQVTYQGSPLINKKILAVYISDTGSHESYQTTVGG